MGLLCSDGSSLCNILNCYTGTNTEYLTILHISMNYLANRRLDDSICDAGVRKKFQNQVKVSSARSTHRDKMVFKAHL